MKQITNEYGHEAQISVEVHADRVKITLNWPESEGAGGLICSLAEAHALVDALDGALADAILVAESLALTPADVSPEHVAEEPPVEPIAGSSEVPVEAAVEPVQEPAAGHEDPAPEPAVEPAPDAPVAELR